MNKQTIELLNEFFSGGLYLHQLLKNQEGERAEYNERLFLDNLCEAWMKCAFLIAGGNPLYMPAEDIES